jgi:hypothetical protein
VERFHPIFKDDIMTNTNAFIAVNSKAYLAFKPIAAGIEARHQDLLESLAAAGILPQDYRAFTVAYVAETSKVEPHESKFGGLTFTKYSKESNRVTYVMAVLTGAAEVKAEARKAAKAGKVEKAGDPLTVALEAFAALSAAQRKAFLAVVAK